MNDHELLALLKKLDNVIHDSLRALDKHGSLNQELKRSSGSVLGHTYFLAQELFEKNSDLYETFKDTWPKPKDLK